MRDVSEMSEYEPGDDQQSRHQTEQDQGRLEEQDGVKPRVLREESQGGELGGNEGGGEISFCVSD